MTNDLEVFDGAGPSLPLQAAVARYVILGKSGAGKTNADAVLIEQFVRVGIPTIVLDPLGTMYGLRSSRDGESAGLAMALFGGDHPGSLPLPPGRASYVADLLGEGVSAILDLSSMTVEEGLEFANLFLPRLLQRAETNMHVVLEEGDRFARNTGKTTPVTQFCRASRNKGIGWTFSTQKPQVLHREVIDTASVFVAMKMTGELAQEAIGGEIGSRIGKKSAARMMADLPSFIRGECWFVPDGDWLGTDATDWEPLRARFRLRTTFEIKPPKVGEQRREPRVLAEADVARIRELLLVDDEPAKAMGAVIERDAGAYREQLARVQTQLADTTAILRVQRERAAHLENVLRDIRDKCSDVLGVQADIMAVVDDDEEVRGTSPVAAALPAMREDTQRMARAAPRLPTLAPAGVKAGAMRIAEMLARCGPLSRRDAGTLADVVRPGTMSEYVAMLRKAGFVEERDGLLQVTPAGRAAVGARGKLPRPSTDDIIAINRHAIKDGALRILRLLVQLYPQVAKRSVLGAQAGVTRPGTLSEYMGSLRKRGLIVETKAGARAGELLFIASAGKRARAS